MTESLGMLTAVFLGIINLVALLVLALRIPQDRRQLRQLRHRAADLADRLQGNRARGNALRERKQLLEEGVETGTLTVEEIHKSITDLTFGVIDRLSANERARLRSRQVREIHDQTVDGVYRSVKTVNRQLGQFADSLIRHSNRRKK
ncbi:hypothetical protein QQM79_06390 [Marinobacteraceae bacterium S3BR75-40.1]